MPITLDTPLALYSIPAIWYTAFYPVNAKFVSMLKTTGYDNLKPRANTGRVKELPFVDTKVAERYARLDGAHENGMENLPLWIGAILAGHIAGLSNRTMNIFSVAYITTRMLYNYVYINQSTIAQSNLRSGLYFFGLSMPLTLLIKSANKLRRIADQY
ncbi:hypothetical protein EW026_g2101 [Hermanssonia centrifuga]|uniref:Uncharacterized protein n=1 Tax=Hermanssonia centrifuga TaxID=98765 RepID=A0A4S4KTV9_9APHY|nr:hypothetical protein EW026_g2101 [Hermanssonia centrifuga]